MNSDLRYLILLNVALIAVSGYAAYKSYLSGGTNPKWLDLAAIESTIQTGDSEEMRELATTLATGLENRVQAVRNDRRRSAVLFGVTTLIAATNLWLIVWIYRKSRHGLYIEDGVMLHKE